MSTDQSPTTKEAQGPKLEPCRCGRKALIEEFYDDDDPQPLFVATCEVCPVKTYDQFSMEEAARVWNTFVSAPIAPVVDNSHLDRIEKALDDVAPQQSDVHWQFRAGVEETMCGVSVESEEGIEVSLLPDKATCKACEAALWGYQCGRADERLAVAPASPTAPILHCSCGAACTSDEYAAHRAMGHDAPAAIRDEALVLSDLQEAYNQGVEDAKCAIRAESQGGGYWAAAYINAIARRCSPFRYTGLPLDADDTTRELIVQAITDIQEARESHVQWAAHLRAPHTIDCQGCTDYAAHIGDAAYHEEWIAKYDNVIAVLARVPFASTPPSTLARKAAEEIANLSYARHREEKIAQFAAIIERCFAAEK